MPDDFDFKKGKKEPGVEASLDDFFQPTETEAPSKKRGSELPIEKERVAQIKDEPELELASEEEDKPREAKKKKAKEKKVRAKKEPGAGGAGPSKAGLILGVVLGVLGLGILAGGGYYAYSKFFKLGPQVVSKKPVSKPEPKAQVKPEEKAVAVEQQPSSAQPGGKVQEKPVSGISPKPAGESKPSPVSAKQAVQPSPSVTRSSPEILSIKPSGKGWSCQVGAYMMPESIAGVAEKLKGYGFQNVYNVDVQRTLTVHHLYLVGSFDKTAGDAKLRSLEQVGFKPKLEPSGNKYRVKVYSYGQKSIAQESRSKVEKAGLGPAEVISRTEPVTLHQLRVGPYLSRSEASKVLSELKSKGFNAVLVEEK